MRVFLFSLDGGLYAVRADKVSKTERLVSVVPVPAAPPSVAGILNLKGKVVPVYNLYHVLGLPHGAINYSLKRRVVVFVSESGEPAAALIDTAEDMTEIEDVSPPPESSPGVVSLGHTASGELVRVIDPALFA